MKKNNKKGFTIVELVIVIAVIAILAAVLIPTFSNMIKSAKESSDCQLVRNLNTAVEVELAPTGKNKTSTAYEAMQYADVEGYDVATIVAKSDNKIAWSVETGNFVLIDVENGTAIYPTTNGVKELQVSGNEVNYFIVVSEMPTEGNATKYSVYAGNNFTATNGKVTLNGVGFDAGVNEGINEIQYSGVTEARNVIIRSNSDATTLTVTDTNENSHITQYGTCGIVNATVAMHSLEINGTVGYLEVTEGHVVVNGTVELAYTTATSSETVLVEGNVEHAHAASQTNATGLNNADSQNKVTWDYDGNTDQNDQDVYHHVATQDNQTLENKNTGVWTDSTTTNISVEKYEVATSAVIAQADKSTEKKAVYNVTIGKYFDTLNSANGELKADTQNVIILLKDTTETTGTTFANGSDVVIDLNGKTVNAAGTITNDGTLKITDTSTDVAEDSGKIIMENNSNASIIRNSSNKTLTIDNGKLYKEGGNLYCISNDGEVIINGGIITSNNNQAISNWGKLTITGGKISNTASYDSGNLTGHDAILNNYEASYEGVLTITGGEITSNNHAIRNQWKTTITGGTIKSGNDTNDSGSVILSNTQDSAEVTISGGSITGEVEITNGTLKISGGTFTSPLTQTIYADGATADITITGGDFSSTNNNKGWMINKNDSVKDSAKISISGGTFHGFNPGGNNADGNPTSYLATGYQSTETSTGVWTVTKKAD